MPRNYQPVKRKRARCAWCRRWFLQSRSDAKYCQNACRQAAYEARKRGER